VKLSFEAIMDLKACKHYGFSGPFNAPVTDALCTGTDRYHWSIQKSELHYLSPSRCKFCSRIIFETKSEFGSTITVASSGLFDAPVTEELCTGTGWYHWNIQKSEEKLEQIIPV
jgi:hypothetical protein